MYLKLTISPTYMSLVFDLKSNPSSSIDRIMHHPSREIHFNRKLRYVPRRVHSSLAAALAVARNVEEDEHGTAQNCHYPHDWLHTARSLSLFQIYLQ